MNALSLRRNRVYCEVGLIETVIVENPDMPAGEENIITKGVEGEHTIVERVFYQDGEETRREILSEKVTAAQVNEVVEVGTQAREPAATELYRLEIETRTEAIPFETVEVENSDLPEGERNVTTEGVEGERTIEERVFYLDGEESDREFLSEEVATAPVNEVVEVGTQAEETEPEAEEFDFTRPYTTEEEARNAGYAYLDSDLNQMGHDGFSINFREGRGYFISPNFNGETPLIPLEPAEPREEEETHGLSLVVHDLEGDRTTNVRIRVTNSDGEQVAGRLNRRGQWRSYEELPKGRYNVRLRTPRGTYAVIIDTITQGTLPTDDRNVFTVDIDEDNLFGRRGVLGAFQLVQTPYAQLVDRLEEIEERLADLEAENEELREEQERLHEELNRLENELAGAEERIAELEDRVDDLESRVDELEEEVGTEDPVEDKEDPVEDKEDPVEDKEDPDKDENPVEDKVDPVEDKEDPVKDKEKPVEEKVSAEVVVNDDDTDGNVGDDTDSKTSEVEAEESLPRTGAATSVVGLGVATILAGLGITAFDHKKRK